MAKNESALATVLAFEKKIVPSDGFMYGTTWGKRHQERSPISLVEKSVRGTISNRLKNAVKNDPLKLNAAVENANLQTVDSAALSLEQDTLQLRFSVKILPGFQNPSVCNAERHLESIQAMGMAYIEKTGCQELAHRYATNIANGRFLWRNRIGAEQIEVTVTIKPTGETITYNAYDYSIKNFDKTDEKLEQLAQYIAETLCGKREYLILEIEANAQIGKGQEVYPSEELILDKSNADKKGKKSKVLYQVNGVAGMHSQKIGNALRTIDTWYPEYTETKFGPIAVEPYGAVTTLGRAFRSPKEKVDFYTLFDAWSRPQEKATDGLFGHENSESCLHEEEEHFVVAVLIRGGVFGQSGKE